MDSALPWALRPPGAVTAYQPGYMRVVDYLPGKAPDAYWLPFSVPEAPAPAVTVPAPVEAKPTGVSVTIISDASCGQNGSGWAAYAKSIRGVVPVTAGKLKAGKLDTTTAELLAFANGLHLALARGVAMPGDSIYCRVDNISSLERIRKLLKPEAMPKRKPLQNQAVIDAAMAHCRKLLADNRLTIGGRHIKAHSGTGDPARYIHDQCDRAARAAMRKD